jgi:pimeloyl-ACP methyl ester carboxylesterase
MEPLLLLHGAIGAASQLEPLAAALRDDQAVHLLNFSGHGGRPQGGEPFSIGLFANDVLQWMDEQRLNQVSIFGYSMGGYVGMYLARHYPEKIKKVVTLATKFHWDEPTAAKETQMLNPEKIEQKIPAFAESLKKMHAPTDWKQVLHNTADLMTNMGKNNPLKPEDYAGIVIPVTLLTGANDKMVSAQETISIQALLPNAQMVLLPETPHPIDQVNVGMLAQVVRMHVG